MLSMWNSPLLIVPKKSQGDKKNYRFCIDFKNINKITETETFPMPNLEEELGKMYGCKIFSTMDIQSAFHQVKLRIEDKEKTAFTAGYRKFQFKRMPFGLKGSPITWQKYVTEILGQLLSKNVMAFMDDEHNDAFETLKTALISAPVLKFPNFAETFYISVDASGYAVGAYISNEKPPNDHPIEYFSKTQTAPQKNYSTTHRELLAIILAIERFQHYIWGKHFVMHTDHQALTYLFNQNKVGSRLLRWKLLLAEYDFDIIHRKGKANVVSDCLSRVEEQPVQMRFFQAVKNPTTKSMLQVITRSRAGENKIIQNEPQNKPKRVKYHINQGII